MKVSPAAPSRAPGSSVALPRHALAAILLRCSFVLLEFLGGVVLARVFLAAGYGVYAMVIACVGVLAIPSTVGLDRYLVREVAVHRARGEWSQMRGLVTRSFRVTLTVSLAIALLAGLIVYWFRNAVSPITMRALLVGLAVIPMVSMARLRSAVLQGLGKVLTGALPESIVLPGTVLVIAVAVLVSPGIERTPTVAVLINALATLVALVVGSWLLRRATPVFYSEAVPRDATHRWLLASLPMASVVGMNLLIANADVILLGTLVSSESAGIYRVAAQLAAVVAFPLGAVNAVLAPRIAGAHAVSDRRELQRLATQSARIVISLALPAAAFLLLLGGVVLSLYGAEFGAARAALNILVVGQLVNAATGSVGYLLIMTQHEKLAAVLFGLAALMNVALNLMLIPRMGVLGAAVAAFATLVLLNASLAIAAVRKLGIYPTAVRRNEG